jgi:hypothetical protein
VKPDDVLSGLPKPLRAELLSCYEAICRNYSENRWEPAELNGGKFAETVYSIVHGALVSSFPAKASKPANMLDACRALEGIPANPNRVGDRSLRILMPRLLPVIYEIRNNRGVGHIGGDVDPNHEDAEAVLAMANWIMAELVRIFHGVTLAQAQATVESIVSRRHPMIWEIEGVKRVLDTSLSIKDQVRLLVYSEPGWVQTSLLRDWVEYSNLSAFRKTVLSKLHEKRLIEHDVEAGRAKISPLGIAEVEGRLL